MWAPGQSEWLEVSSCSNTEDFQARAPAAQLALPTWEHYAPVLVAAGAVADERPSTTFPITGWWMDGAFTKRSVQFG